MAKKSLVNFSGRGYTGLPLPTQPTDAASKEYVDNQITGVGGLVLKLPFWDNTDTQSCIDINAGKLPFWDANDVQNDIDMGC